MSSLTPSTHLPLIHSFSLDCGAGELTYPPITRIEQPRLCVYSNYSLSAPLVCISITFTAHIFECLLNRLF